MQGRHLSQVQYISLGVLYGRFRNTPYNERCCRCESDMIESLILHYMLYLILSPLHEQIGGLSFSQDLTIIETFWKCLLKHCSSASSIMEMGSTSEYLWNFFQVCDLTVWICTYSTMPIKVLTDWHTESYIRDKFLLYCDIENASLFSACKAR